MAFKRANSSTGEGRRRKKRSQKHGAADFENSHVENSIYGQRCLQSAPGPAERRLIGLATMEAERP
jgi:hypothetical protein